MAHAKRFSAPGALLILEVFLAVQGGYAFLHGFLIALFFIALAWSLLTFQPLLRRYPSLIGLIPFHAPFPTPEELSGTYIRNRAFRLADVVNEYNGIEGITFEACHIHGPGVIFASHSEFGNCTFAGAPINATFWSAHPDDNEMVGPVNVERCRFLRCRFYGLGVIGPRDEIEKYRAHFATRVVRV